jgi:hypothetical protein
MTISMRPNQLTILGIIAGVAAIPVGILSLLFLAEKLIR